MAKMFCIGGDFYQAVDDAKGVCQMSKVRELHRLWERDMGASRSERAELMSAIESDEAEDAKACEEQASTIARMDDLIRNLEAELAKPRELPVDVRVIVDQLRRSHITSAQVHRLVSFIDEQYPKPKSQAELDAEYAACIEAFVEAPGRGVSHDKLREIAKRLREGKTT